MKYLKLTVILLGVILLVGCDQSIDDSVIIKGYCTGVMNKLLSNDIQLTCTRENCPMKNTFKSECTFKVAFKGEE